MTATRQQVEEMIEMLIALLDKMDGDADFEPEVLEDQHDREADITWTSGHAPHWFVIAERARKKARLR